MAHDTLTNTQRFFLKAIALGLIYVNRYGVIRNEVTGNYFMGTKGKYLTVILKDWGRDNKRRGILQHLLVWIRYHGPIPKGMEIKHKDGDKHNNWLSNLELVTSKQNKAHAARTGLHVRLGGQHAGRAFYKDKQVVRLRKEWRKSGLSMFEFWRTQPPHKRPSLPAFRSMLNGKRYRNAEMI